MVTCESTKSYKIPLKSCHDSVIDHNHVTICLSVEWPEKGGDDPKLVIDITDKRPSISYTQQSQSSSSMVINSAHHHYQQQQQENFQSTYQQQYYHQHHLSAPNNHDLSRAKPTTTTITSGDHNDVSSTTATVLYDVIQPQPLSQSQISTPCATIQQIKNHLKSQLSPIFRRQSIPNEQYLSPQHVIQTPSNMNDNRLNTQMSTISPPSSIKQIPSITTHIHDLQQPPSIITYPSSTGINSQLKSLVCRCLNPTNQHEHNCPVITMPKLQLNTNLTSESMYSPPNDRAIAHRTSFPPRAYLNDTMTISAALSPFPNSNLTKTPVGSSANVTTIVSQHSPFLNNNPMGPIGNTPSFNIDNNFQRDSFMFPQEISNQSNYQTSPSIPIVRKQNSTSTVPRSRKTRPVKHNSLTHQDQTSNNSQQSSHNINKINSPSLLTNPIQLPQGLFRLQDGSQTTTNLSPTNTQHASTNDITGCNTQQQHSPRTSSMIRSPVKLDFSVPQNSTPSSISTADIDQTIADVAKGKGAIILGNKAIVTGSQQKQSSSPTLVWEQNGPVTTKTYLSPLHQKQQQQVPLYDSNVSTLPHQNVVNITQQIVRPPIIEQNGMDTLVQQQATNKSKKRIQPKLSNDTGPKRSRKTKINTSQSTIKSTVTSASTLIDKPISSSGLSISSSSSSSGCVTTTDTSKENLNSDFANNAWQTPNLNDNNAPNDIREQVICPGRFYAFDLDDVYSSKTEERFNASTPPPLLPSISISASIPGQLLTPASSGKSSTISVTNPDDVYEDFFSSHILSSSSTSQENQVTSSVLTPPDFQNNLVPQQQYHSQTFEFDDSDLQPQAHTSQIISNTSNQMNTHNNAETLSTQTSKSFQRSNGHTKKSLKRSSKPSKQQNRLNSNRKHICTRCGLAGLVDITQHEFPKQRGLVFECASCGNSAVKSNVSADERRRRLAKVAADHLERVECQFCHTIFHCHNDYLMHLRNDHASNKPM